MSTIHERRLARMASASEVISASEFRSPLAQVRSLASSLPPMTGDPGPSSLLHQQQQTRQTALAYSPPQQQVVPPLDFNLFRTNSVYSVSSINTLSSFETSSAVSSEDYDDAFNDQRNRFSFSSGSSGSEDDGILDMRALERPRRTGAETPTQTTPKAERVQYFDFGLGPPIPASGSDSAGAGLVSAAIPYGRTYDEEQTGQATPTKSSFLRSHPVGNESQSAARPLAETHRDIFNIPGRGRHRADSAAREGEVPALLPHRQSRGGADWESIHGEQGSEWGEDEAGYEWLDKDGLPIAVNGREKSEQDGHELRGILSSPSKGLAKLKSVVSGGMGHTPGQGPATDAGVSGGKELREGRKLRKHLVIPRRAAPPPPAAPGPIVPPRPADGKMNHSIQQGIHRAASPNTAALASGSTDTLIAPRIKPRSGSLVPAPEGRRPAGLAPTMIPMRDPVSAPTRPRAPFKRSSHLSIQSTAFSLYDLDGSPSAPTPRATTPSGGELAFPKGTYMKVSASALATADVRSRNHSDPSATPRSPLLDSRGASKGDLLERGVSAREKGDLPKAAWYFRQAADAGSVTGRIYWGLALRHGWGVARDERKAFGELRQACDQSMHTGSRELLTADPIANLSIEQKKAVARDISMGMFEVANCFLDGVGVKKDSEVAVAYLRFAGNLGDLASQEQLGFLLSKGGNGIKKDMREAAKWYRMAIGQGSSTIGLAWVWKVSIGRQD